jgi:Holliday junction resolvase-like predicted endonuclease
VISIRKSSRHSKITGDFGEHLILYWLSKCGFECARVDHTGIDIIARHPTQDEVLGVSVKSRSRSVGKEDTALNIKVKEFAAIRAACVAFHCTPYHGIVVDSAQSIHLFLVPLTYFKTAEERGKKVVPWSGRKAGIARYCADASIRWIAMNLADASWW